MRDYGLLRIQRRLTLINQKEFIYNYIRWKIQVFGDLKKYELIIFLFVCK